MTITEDIQALITRIEQSSSNAEALLTNGVGGQTLTTIRAKLDILKADFAAIRSL